MLWAGLVLGLAVLINFIFIVKKFKTGRPIDAFVDIATIMLTSSLYGMSLMGGAIATVGSMFISIYLHYRPLNLFTMPEVATNNTHSSRSWVEKFDSLFD